MGGGRELGKGNRRQTSFLKTQRPRAMSERRCVRTGGKEKIHLVHTHGWVKNTRAELMTGKNSRCCLKRFP